MAREQKQTLHTATAGIGKRKKRRKCTIKNCDRPHKARGLCVPHYQRLRAGRSLEPEIRLKRKRHGPICTEEGCYRPYKKGGLCKTCYAREYYHRRKRRLAEAI